MEHVTFSANSRNVRSLNAMKSIGCVLEGILRNSRKDANGNRIDITRLNILRNEWYDDVKAKLKNGIKNVAIYFIKNKPSKINSGI